MRFSKKLIAVGLLSVFIPGLIAIASVGAVTSDLTSQQTQRIRENCIPIKTTLNQLHASDALLRVNRGQLYESMSIKLMSRFNERVASNNRNNSSLASITNRYNSILSDFRGHYQTYEEHLSHAISIDCQKEPVSFYDAVSVAKVDRDKVHSDVAKLNHAIDQYREALSEFEQAFLNESKGGN